MWSLDYSVEFRTCFPLAQPFISRSRQDWLLLVLPILAFGKDGISQCTGVLTSIDPGVALTILDRALNIQVTYGAVMLSFLGEYLPAFPQVSELISSYQGRCTGEWNSRAWEVKRAMLVSH
jgi:hypothetical protein